MKSLKERFYYTLLYHSNNTISTLADALLKDVAAYEVEKASLKKQKSEEFDRDRYADNNKGWKYL